MDGKINKKGVKDFGLLLHHRKYADCAVVQGTNEKWWHAEIWETSDGYRIFCERSIRIISNEPKMHKSWRLQYEYTDIRNDQIDTVCDYLIKRVEATYGPVLRAESGEESDQYEESTLVCDSEPEIVETEIASDNEDQYMKVSTMPTTRFIRRIRKDFDRKILLGDVKVDDDEYQILIEYLKSKLKWIRNAPDSDTDPVVCVALVQVGIRCYDGKFWPHIKEELDLEALTGVTQRKIGEYFNRTLKKNGKLIIDESEYMNNILVHSFVTDYYATNFFNFLFAFYSIDLERDMARLDKSTMNSLIEVIQRNDNTGRTYFLVTQTADAVRSNPKGSKVRIRRFLKLIDNAFWGETLPRNSSNRLTQQFIKWIDSSRTFEDDKSRYGTNGRGKKSFSIPHIKYDQRNESFKIILPSQIIRYDDIDSDEYYWRISAGGKTKDLEIDLYDEGVTGFKTEKLEVELPKELLFSTITFEIIHEEMQVRRFKIAAEPIRFFDGDGTHIKGDSLTKGMAVSFSDDNGNPQSSAILYSDRMGELTRTFYDFVDDDIVIMSDGTTYSVGKKIKEGLLPRNRINRVNAQASDDEIVPVFSAFPQILIRMLPQRANGTAVIINGKPHRLYSGNVLAGGFSRFKINDPSGECGFMFNPEYFGYSENGLYKISVDIPNDHSRRAWKFLLIRDFSFYFADEPYIFKSKGTLCYPKEYTFNTVVPDTKIETSDENRYDFDIVAGNPTIALTYGKIKLLFDIPALSYKFEGEDWQVNPHIDVWHLEFIPRLWVDYPKDKIAFSLDEDVEDYSGIDTRETFDKIKSRNVFECDLNRFRSWFGRNKMVRHLYIELPDYDEPVDFLKVITRSYLSSVVLTGDFNKGTLVGKFDIIGKSSYFADLVLSDEVIAEKVEIIDGQFEIQSDLKTGKYEVIVYENDSDDSGFGDEVYDEIGRSIAEITNPADLSGKSISIVSIIPEDDQNVYLPLSLEYKVVGLEKASELGQNCYQGKMIVMDHIQNYYPATFNVYVEFFNLNELGNAYITFWDDGDSVEFLYDAVSKKIVKQQNDSYSSHQAYRRYQPILYPEEYIYKVSFTDASNNELRLNVDDGDYNNLVSRKKSNSIFKTSEQVVKKSKPVLINSNRRFKESQNPNIDNMSLSRNLCLALRRIGLRTAHDIYEYDCKKGILKVKSVDIEAVKELGGKLERIGYNMPSYALFRSERELENEKADGIVFDLYGRNLVSDDLEPVSSNAIKDTDRLSDVGLKRYIWNTLYSSGIRTVGDLMSFVRTNGVDNLIGLQYFSEGKLRGVKKFLTDNSLI